mgnify:CR=1 FL=1
MEKGELVSSFFPFYLNMAFKHWCLRGCGKSVVFDRYRAYQLNHNNSDKKYFVCSRCNGTFTHEEIIKFRKGSK